MSKEMAEHEQQKGEEALAEAANTETTKTDTGSENNITENVGNMVDKVKNVGKGFLDRWGGKGLIGAASGLLASKTLFKVKSPITMLVMAGGGFVLEKMLTAKEKSNDLVAYDVSLAPELTTSNEASVTPEASTENVQTDVTSKNDAITETAEPIKETEPPYNRYEFEEKTIDDLLLDMQNISPDNSEHDPDPI